MKDAKKCKACKAFGARKELVEERPAQQKIGDTNSVNSPTSSTSSIYYHALTVIEKNNLINQIDLVNSQVYGDKV